MENERIVQILKALWRREYPRQSTRIIDLFSWELDLIPVMSIKTFRPRNIKKAKKYSDLIEQGEEFPPVVVIRSRRDNKSYKIIDGYHRMWAYKKLEIPCVIAYIGTLKT